jgi:hypothetical protein
VLVATALLVGARRANRERMLRRGLIEPFRSRRRFVAAGSRSSVRISI